MKYKIEIPYNIKQHLYLLNHGVFVTGDKEKIVIHFDTLEVFECFF